MTDSIKQGWVRIYRQSLDSSVWKNPNTWFVWSWCLLKANHQTNKFPFNGEDIELQSGQFITGINRAINELPNISPQKYRTVITYLKSTGRITIKTTNKFSIITILKWKDYQQDNRQTNKPVTNQQQTSNKQITTNKNDKKEKNEKNEAFLVKNDSLKKMKSYNEQEHSDKYENTVDLDTGELVIPLKKNPPRNKTALTLISIFNQMCVKNIKTAPVPARGSYFLMIDAIKYLSSEQVIELMDEWFRSGKEKEELIQITQCLSKNQINRFLVKHQIK